MKSILALTGLDLTNLTASQEAQQQRDDLLVTSGEVKKIADQQDAEDAGRVLSSLKTFTRSIEDTRKSVGAPVLDLTKRINALAASLIAELDDEAARISSMLGTYNAEQERIAARKRQESLDEEQRIIRETRAKLEEAENAGASDKKLDRIEDKAIAQLTQAKATTAAQVAPKVAGVSTRREICFEVTDIKALYAAHPMFVTLTANTALIKAALKQGALPGVRHWEESKAIVR